MKYAFVRSLPVSAVTLYLLALSGPLCAAQGGSWFVGGGLDLLWPNHRDNMTVPNGSDYTPPQNLDHFSVNLPSTQKMLDLNGGYRWQRQETFVPGYTLGFRYQHVFAQNIRGNIKQYSLDEFDNYTYLWGVGADVFTAHSKLDLIQYGSLMPYVDGGVGVSVNRAMTYTESALPEVTARFSPAFRPHSQAQFSYSVGAGVDMLVNEKLIMSVGYDYLSLGHLRSGKGLTTWSGTQLKFGRYSANTLQLGVTCLIDDVAVYHPAPGK